MDPLCSSQDAIRCTLCEFAVAPMYCENCHIELCGQCVEKHFADKSKVHKVAPLKQSLTPLQYPKCSTHASKQCELHCEQCDISICTQCVSSKQHKHHDVVDIMEYYEEKQKNLREDLQELETSIYLKYKEATSIVSNMRDDLKKNSQLLKTSLKAQGEAWHREIDSIIEKMQDKVDEVDSQNLEAINKQGQKINTTITQISQLILDLRRLLDSGDVCLVSKYKSRNEEFRTLPPELNVSFPNFRPCEINLDQFITQFGTLSTLATDSKEQDPCKPFKPREESKNCSRPGYRGRFRRQKGKKEKANEDPMLRNVEQEHWEGWNDYSWGSRNTRENREEWPHMWGFTNSRYEDYYQLRGDSRKGKGKRKPRDNLPFGRNFTSGDYW